MSPGGAAVASAMRCASLTLDEDEGGSLVAVPCGQEADEVVPDAGGRPPVPLCPGCLSFSLERPETRRLAAGHRAPTPEELDLLSAQEVLES